MECRKGQEQNHSTIQRAGSEPLAPPKFALGLRAVAPLARAVGLSLSLSPLWTGSEANTHMSLEV